MDEVKENLFIYDKTKKHLFQVRWFNSLSHKMNAILFKNVGYSSARIINILGRFTFNNKPIKIVMVEYDKNNIIDNTDDDDNNELDLSVIDDDEAEDKQTTFDKNQKNKINVRTYIKTGYDKTNLTDTNENYIINGGENQPEKMGVEYNDMNFKIETETNNSQIKEEFKNIFSKMIITNKKNAYLQTKNIKFKSTRSKKNKNKTTQNY